MRKSIKYYIVICMFKLFWCNFNLCCHVSIFKDKRVTLFAVNWCYLAVSQKPIWTNMICIYCKEEWILGINLWSVTIIVIDWLCRNKTYIQFNLRSVAWLITGMGRGSLLLFLTVTIDSTGKMHASIVCAPKRKENL